MSCSVVIDSFDSQEDAVNFVIWFKQQADAGKINLVRLDSTVAQIDYDGNDDRASSPTNITFNIVTNDLDPEEEEVCLHLVQ